MEYNNRERYLKNKRNDRYRSRDALQNYEYRNSRKKKAGRGAITSLFVFSTLLVAIIAVFFVLQFLNNTIGKSEESKFTDAQMKHDIYIDYSIIGMKYPLGIRGLTRQDVYDKVRGSYEWDLTISNSNPELDIFDMPKYEDVEVEESLNQYLDTTNLDAQGTSQKIEVDNPYKNITIKATKDTYKFPDFLDGQLKSQIDSIYETYLRGQSVRFEKKAATNVTSPDFKADFKFEVNENDNSIDEYLNQLAILWKTTAVKGQIEGFDKTKNEFIFGDEHKGCEIDVEAMRKRIFEEVGKGNLKANIYTILKFTDPIGETIKSKYKYVSNFETTTTNNEVRNTNIQLACDAINGLILKPNEEFSFNNIVGERTESKGYGLAQAYSQGEVVEELGGGVCQVSTTLYNAVFAAGLTTTYRRSHTFEPNYVTPGLDATVSFNGVDYRFINDSEYSIGIRTTYKNKKVKAEIFAVPKLEKDVKQYLLSKKIQELDEPPISIIESGTATKGTKGSEWQVFKVVKKGDEEIERVHDHYAKYVGHTPTAYEENTYIDKEGVLQTRTFKSTGTVRTTSPQSSTNQQRTTRAQENQTRNRTTERPSTTQTTEPIPLPVSQNANVISPAESFPTPR